MVRALKAAGHDLEIIGVTDDGQSGAAFVRWPDGREAVVTTAFATLDHMQQTARVLSELRSIGIPVPIHEVLYDCGDGRVAVVQERMPGTTPPTSAATPGLVDAVVAMNDRFAGWLADRPEFRLPEFHPRSPDDSVINMIEREGARATRLVRASLAALDHPDPGGSDLLHSDLTLSNVLVDDRGEITGVIDWNYGAKRGDRRYALVKLLHTLTYSGRTSADFRVAGSVRHLEDLLESRLYPATFRSYWADQTINMMYVSLRWGTAEAFWTYLTMGESRLL